VVQTNGIHHIAILCSDYPRSKDFYTRVLGLQIVRETYRAERDSFKLDLALNGTYVIELFSFPAPPPRSSRPEATGLRHLAFEVDSIEAVATVLKTMGIDHEAIRVDAITNKRFLFTADPDNLPIEFYEK
jgi:glyoxylase I family protein